MTTEADLTIWDAGTGAVLLSHERLRLPVEIGRFGDEAMGRAQGGDGRVVYFGRGLGTLSRSHMTVAPAEDGGAIVTDTSSNGVARALPGHPPAAMGQGVTAHQPAGSMRQFHTVGLIVEVGLPSDQVTAAAVGTSLYAVYESRSGGDKSIALSRGVIALIADGNTVAMQSRAEASADAAATALAAEAVDCLGVIGPDGAGGFTAIATRDGAMTCNRSAMAAATPRPLAHLDTIELGPLALRIMSEDGGKALVCINEDCRQMNPYAPSVNCRYCGTRLGDAHTKILPKEARP